MCMYILHSYVYSLVLSTGRETPMALNSPNKSWLLTYVLHDNKPNFLAEMANFEVVTESARCVG